MTPADVANYACSKCQSRGVKLWRGVHGCKDKDGHELLCATCLVPGQHVSSLGRVPLDMSAGMSTDQVKGWLPAVPTGDTFWGYTSVPPDGVSWWRALPTYPFSNEHEEALHLRAVLAKEQDENAEWQRRYLREIERGAERADAREEETSNSREGSREGEPQRDVDPRQGMGAEGGPGDGNASDKPTAQVQGGAYDPQSASAPQPSTERSKGFMAKLRAAEKRTRKRAKRLRDDSRQVAGRKR